MTRFHGEARDRRLDDALLIMGAYLFALAYAASFLTYRLAVAMGAG